MLELNKSLNNRVVTTIEEESQFYLAEAYHHNYYNLNKNVPYCSVVIGPKIEKLLNSNNSFLKKN